MKYIKKGNKIIVAKDNDDVVGSILTDTTFRVSSQNETIRFNNSDFSIDFANLTSITDDFGNTKVKADFTSFQSFVNYFANSIFFLTSGKDSNYKGVFATPTVLNTALPTGQSGWFAYVVSTATYWYWDSTPVGNWINTGSANSPGVTLFNGRQGAVEPQAGDYDVSQVTGAAPLSSPAFSGTPTAPTPATPDNSTKLATTEYVQNNLALINQEIENLKSDFISWTWTIERSGFSTNILNSATPKNFLQYFMTGSTPPTPTVVINEKQLQPINFVFDSTNPLSPILIFPAINGEVEYKIRASITGAYSGTTSTSRVLPFDIQRVSDNSLVGSPKHIKDLNTNTITNEFIELTTRTIGVTDNFSVTGIRFMMTQNTGSTLTFTSVQFYVSARVIRLN